MKKYILSILFLISLCFTVIAQVDSISIDNLLNMSVEELMNVKIVTSSRKLEKAIDAPNVVYVITCDEIKKRGYKSYHDLLTTIPGLNVFFGDFGYFSQVRGVAPNAHNKVTYMINGVQVNQLVEANMLTGPTTLENADRIEVIVGPGSVLYGAETLLAIVNIITKTDSKNEITIRMGHELSEGTALFGHQNLVATASKKWNENKYFNVTFSVLKNEGWNAFDTLNITNSNFMDKAEGRMADHYNPSFYLNANARMENFNFQYISYNSEMIDIGHSQEKNSEGVRIDRVEDFMFQHLKDFKNNISTRLQLNFSNKRFSRTTTAGIGNNTDLSQVNYNFEMAVNYLLNNIYIQSGFKYQINQNNLNYNMYWAPDDPRVSKDTSYVMQFVDGNNYNTYGFYVSGEWKIKENLKIVLASRFDRNEILKEKKIHISPRAAIIYSPWSNFTSKLMYNISTHMPTPRQSSLNMIYGSDKPDGIAPVWAQTNISATKPERLRAFEYQSIISFKTQMISVNTYYQEIKDFISWFNPSTNMGNFSGYGFEAEWKTNFSKRVGTWFNFSYTNTNFELTAQQYKESSNFPSNEIGESVAVPIYMANGGVDFAINNYINFSIVSRYFTKQTAYIITSNKLAENYRDASWGYVNNKIYLDANLFFKNIYNGLDFGLGCKNLTNNTDLIAAQFREYRYHPRGAFIYASFKFSF